MDRWVQGIGVRVIQKLQKRVAYFDCTAALGDNCGALSHVGLPSFASPASLVRPHLRHAMVGGAGWHRSSEDSTRKRSGHQ